MQSIVPLFVASIVNVFMTMRSHRNLLAKYMLIKLWVLPKFTKIKSEYLSTCPVTLGVRKLMTTSKVLMEMCGVICSRLNVSFLNPLLSFTSSSSSSTIHGEYNLLFLHLYFGTNFSSHQKHKPLALVSSNSLFLIGMVGFMVGL